ncbi:putative repressor LexA [[Clostridium] leptum DSM 753]|uniref:LexA family transcriptional regulator n=1 Tax=[Clostridium] leptum DSM 753 TaxID=428125 RepID=A7VTE0_9FIRM|nr:putative repressor LexA [[Clostridium] leptum DSM 753]PEQ23203.1 LexA family transcriptional regulator [[Clostridium] leptum DSM 753]DAO88614.1 MAG TPA: Repressor protein CI [Caudoviricetes sp.]
MISFCDYIKVKEVSAVFRIRLKELRENAGLSQYGFAEKIGISQSTVGNWEAGSREPNFKTMERIADFFGVSVDYLLGRETVAGGPPEPSVPGSKWIPVIGTIPAGTPVEAIEDILDYEEITPQMASQGEHFALKIKGQSMEPKISDGDVVIVRKQDDCENGEIAVVLVNGDEATVKRIKKGPEGLMLIPNNPAYEPMFYSNAEIESLPVSIIGKVVELRAKF